MLANLSVAAMNLIVLQGQWDLRTMWHNMSIIAQTVVGILFLLSAWSLGVMIDRVLMYSAARKQSRVFVQQVAGPSATRRAISPRLSPQACLSSNPPPPRLPIWK